MEACYECKVQFGTVNTNTWRAHCGVKGKTRVDKKRSAQLLIREWFGISCSEDEADAIGLGKYYSDSFMSKVEIVDWET